MRETPVVNVWLATAMRRIGGTAMLEGMPTEIPHKLTEPEPDGSSREWVIEIVAALMLSLVAVATAWCGYHAARWDGRQAFLYGTSARLRVEAAVAATEGGDQRLLDAVTFNTWIRLTEEKNEKLAGIYVRRFTPEYKVAFDAWLKTDPFNSPSAPPGPAFMPEYRNPLLIEAARLNQEANEAFSRGTEARENSELYVRRTVMLATVLFLTAIAMRFKVRKVQVSLLAVAGIPMVFHLANVAMHPRL